VHFLRWYGSRLTAQESGHRDKTTISSACGFPPQPGLIGF